MAPKRTVLKARPQRVAFGRTYLSKHAADETLKDMLEDGWLKREQDPYVDCVKGIWVISIRNPRR